MLSPAAASWLHTTLAEAADALSFDRRNMLSLTPGLADEIEQALQGWRSQLAGEPAPMISRALVEEAFEALSVAPRLVELAAHHPNDSDLGGLVRELVTGAPGLLRAHLLLAEALAP